METSIRNLNSMNQIYIYIYIYIYNIKFLFLERFSHQCLLMVFHWSVSDSKHPQVFRSLLRILDCFNNAVVWTVSTCPVISKSSNPCTNPLMTVPRAPIKIVVITFMYNGFFSPLGRLRYVYFFTNPFNFTPVSAIIIIIIAFLVFFSPALADGFAQKFE